MPVTVKVNGTSNSLCHKGSSGTSVATVPDVCKTPSPGGPVPIPYPNISQSATLDKGTSTVKADGGMMIAVKGSEFSISNGDNPGVAGGVKSSTFMKESTWVLYSFDVKIEGQNACRLTDKKLQNHENAADLAGLFQFPVLVSQEEPQCYVCCAIICCDEAKYQKKKHKKVTDKNGDTISGVEQDCRSLSTTKHSCVLRSLRKATGPNHDLTTTNRFDNIRASPPGLKARGKDVIPDIIVNGNHVIDAKFPCSKEPTRPAPLRFESHRSADESWHTMPKSKEADLYMDIQGEGIAEEGIQDSEAVGPHEAREKMKKLKCADCDCHRGGGYQNVRPRK